jgi:Domain of unknown function (DUF4443)
LILEEVLGNWRRGTTGPLPQLTPLQLFLALLVIEREGPIGRRALAKALEANDGTVRGLLERLGEREIVKVEENGVSLSAKGKATVRGLFKQMFIRKIESLDRSDLVPGKYAAGIHFAGGYSPGLTGILQRDEAIRSGAQGSITIAVQREKLVMPPDNRDLLDVSLKENARLRNVFELKNRDLVIIGFADDPHRALAGAIAAVLSLTAQTKA